jgi:ABC-type nickel/cobalt efflux system permease component RcnA
MKGGFAMSTISEQTSEARGLRVRILVPEMWASLAIAVIWLVVLVDALFGPDIVANSAAGDFTRVPSVIIVAFFAFLGTWVIARHGFGHRGDDEAG